MPINNSDKVLRCNGCKRGIGIGHEFYQSTYQDASYCMDCANGKTAAPPPTEWLRYDDAFYRRGEAVTGRSRRSEPEIQSMPRVEATRMHRVGDIMADIQIEARPRVQDEVEFVRVNADRIWIVPTPPSPDWVREYFETYGGRHVSASVYRSGTNNIADVAQ